METEQEQYRTIRIKESAWRDLWDLRQELREKSMDTLVRKLIDQYRVHLSRQAK